MLATIPQPSFKKELHAHVTKEDQGLSSSAPCMCGSPAEALDVGLDGAQDLAGLGRGEPVGVGRLQRDPAARLRSGDHRHDSCGLLLGLRPPRRKRAAESTVQPCRTLLGRLLRCGAVQRGVRGRDHLLGRYA